MPIASCSPSPSGEALGEALGSDPFVSGSHVAPQKNGSDTKAFANGQLHHPIMSTDPPLGVMSDRTYARTTYGVLQSRDMLVLYTDGIVESFNDQDEQFGEAKLLETLASMRHARSSEVIDDLFAQVGRFAGENSYQDDKTIVVLKVEPW